MSTESLAIATAPRKGSKYWNAGEITWDELVDWAENPASDKECGNYLLGTLKGRRRLKGKIVSRSAVQLDADWADEELWNAVLALPFLALIHTTYSSTPEDLRFRIIVPLSRNADPAEYRRIARWLMEKLGSKKFDPGSIQPERYMFKPSAKDLEAYRHEMVPGTGELLDVDDTLSVAPEDPGEDPSDDRPAAEVASAEEHAEFLEKHTEGRSPEHLFDRLATAQADIQAEIGRNSTTIKVLPQIYRDARAGLYPAREGEDALRQIILSAPGDDFSDEWAGLVGKALGYALADAREDLGDVFAATPELRHIRQAARARMIGPTALLAYVLVRVLAEVPPQVNLPPTIGGAASLNLGVAVVGRSGSGKSATMEVSRELMGGVGLDQAGIERALGSGEGLAQTFLRRDKGRKENVLISDPRRIMSVDEIASLGATQGRNGATIAPMLRTALNGGQLGQENASEERRRFVAAGTYRLVMLAGIQPTRSGVLLNDTDAGSPQRFVWVPGADKDIPDEEESWPGDLDWEMPDAVMDIAYIEYPDAIKAEVRAARREQMRRDTDGLEGHLMLTRLKVGAALALLHGDVEITGQWWRLARRIVEASVALQEACRAVLTEESQRDHRFRGRLDADRERGRAEAQDERVIKAAQSIWRKVQKHSVSPKDGNDQKHEPGDGCTARCFTRALRDYADRSTIRDPAWDYADGESWIEERGDRWFPGQSQPA